MKNADYDIAYFGNGKDKNEEMTVWMPFLDWTVSMTLCADREDDCDYNYIKVWALNPEGRLYDATEEFLIFNSAATEDAIQPNGSNLYQVMDLLRTVYKSKQDKKGGKNG